MIAKHSNADAAFQKSVDLLLSLHRLTLAGRDQMDDGDVVRDQMEAPWYAMSAKDQARVDGLSADLYSIGNERATSTGLTPSAILADEIQALIASEDWDGILIRIREQELSLDPRDVAYARGICWAHLEMPNVAIEFLTDAGRLRSLSATEESLLLTCYLHAGRAAEVLGRAQDIQASTQQPLLLLKAAEIYSLTAEESRSEAAAEYRQAAIDCAEKAVALQSEKSIDPNSSEFQSSLLSGLLHLALNYEQLGNREKAVDACRRALETFPGNLDALMIYGFLAFDRFPDAHRADFIQSRRSQFIDASFDRLLTNPRISSSIN